MSSRRRPLGWSSCFARWAAPWWRTSRCGPAFVSYTAGAPTAIDAARSVKYIGLWGGAGTPQHAWATVQAKTAAETPTAAEISDASYAGADPALLAKQATARAAIVAKAQAWTDRIDTAFHSNMNSWISA